MNGELNARQQRFVDEYLIHGNGAKAAANAGYAKAHARGTALRLRTKPHIRAKIEAAQAERAAEVKITQADVLRMLLDTYRLATEANQHQAAAKAAELLGRHLSMFTDRLRLEPGRELSDADLVAELASNDAELAATLLALLGRVNDKPTLN